MATDLRGAQDDEIEAEYHRRLQTKNPADAVKSIASTGYSSVPGGIGAAPAQPNQTPLQDYGLDKPRTAQFIGQSGQVVTKPYEDISASMVDKRGNVRPSVIDARAPVKYGGALTGPSLGPEDQFRAQFQPSQDLQSLINRDQSANAASRVKNLGYDPVSDILQSRQDNLNSNARIGAQQGVPLAQNTDDGIGNDPFRKFFGGGLPTPSPTPIPTPPKMVDDTPYWRKNQDQYS